MGWKRSEARYILPVEPIEFPVPVGERVGGGIQDDSRNFGLGAEKMELPTAIEGRRSCLRSGGEMSSFVDTLRCLLDLK